MKKILTLLLTIFLLLTGCSEITENVGVYSNMAAHQETGQISVESTDSVSNLPELHTNYEYTAQELCTERDGLSIYGEAYIPDVSEAKSPIVIMSHGFNNNYASQVEYAAKLAEIGIASYIFDFCGGSTGSRSDGAMLDMSLRTEMTDLNAVIDFVQTLDFVDTENIFLMGRSMGGAVSALVAAQRRNDIKGLILIYPAFVIPDNSKQYESVDDIPDQTTLMGATIGKRFHEDIWEMDIYDEIQGYRNDVLIIHGDKDSLVPISYSEHAVATYDSARLVVLEGAGHGFYGQDADQTIIEMIDYIRQQMI